MKKFYPKYLKQDYIDTVVLFRFAYKCNAEIGMLDEHLKTQKARILRLSSKENFSQNSTKIQKNSLQQYNIGNQSCIMSYNVQGDIPQFKNPKNEVQDEESLNQMNNLPQVVKDQNESQDQKGIHDQTLDESLFQKLKSGQVTKIAVRKLK